MDFGNGYAFKSGSYIQNGLYKVLTIKNVQDGSVDCSMSNRIDELPPKMKPFCKLQPGNVVLSLTGNVGRVGIVPEENCLLNQRVAVLQPYNYALLPGLYFHFRQKAFQNEMIGIAKGTAQANLSPVETLKLEMPYNKSFFEISQKLKPAFDLILANTIESKRLTVLRDALLPKLMSGEIDVSKIDLTQLNSHLAEYRPPCRGLRSLVLPDSLPTCSACGWSPGNKADQTETICESMLSRGEYGLHLLPRALRSNPRDVVDLTGGQAIKAAAKATRRSGGCRSRDILIQLVSGMTGTRCHQLLARARRSSSPLLLAVLADGDACRGCGRAGNA